MPASLSLLLQSFFFWEHLPSPSPAPGERSRSPFKVPSRPSFGGLELTAGTYPISSPLAGCECDGAVPESRLPSSVGSRASERERRRSAGFCIHLRFPAGKAHLKKAIMKHEEAMRIHGLCKILRKMDILQEVLSFAHKRSLSKYSEIDHEEDFFETGDAPDILRKYFVLFFFLLVGVGTEGFYGLPQPCSRSGMRRQQLPLCSCLTGCLCSSLLTASQNASEARDQTPQLLPGEGDRPLPQAGTYSCKTGVAPWDQLSPPPLHALLSCSLSSPSSCSLSRMRRLLAHRTPQEEG